MRSPDTAARPLTSSAPVVMAPRPDGAEVVWSVTEPALGHLEWRLAEEPASAARTSGVDRYGFVPQGTEVLRVRLDSLSPGRTYELRTITTAAADGLHETSAWTRLRTLNPHAATSSFVAWNDTHQQERTLELLDARSPAADVWVWNGDVCNNWTDPAEIAPTLLAPAGLSPSARRPLAFSWGNHDVRGPWAYRLPEIVATPEGLPYYAMRIGPVAAIVLSTGEDKPDDHPSFGGRAAFEALRERQADWLARQILEPGFADAPYRIVFCHMPLRWLEEPVLTEHDYATGRWDEYSRVSRELWHDALVAWGAQAIISGHTHRAARIDPAPGFPYTQLVGGGNAPEDATWIEGTADGEALTITARLLDGSVAHETRFVPIV